MMFSEDEFAYFLEINPGRKAKEVSEMINEKFGSNYSEKQIYYFKKNNKFPSGVDTKFKKGQQSHFKGKKLTKEQYEKLSNTFFKKGNLPTKTRPLYDERIGKHGYLEIKISNNKWISKARFIYEKEYGPIGKNELIRFIDGKENYDLNNLIKVTKSVNLIANKNHFNFENHDLQVAALNLAKLIDLRQKEEKRIKNGR